MTEWKSIIGYENEYLVSNNGDVFSLRSKKRLKPSINEKGYMRVCLQKRGMKSWKRVNRLVAEAFIPNPEDKPTVNHKNGIRDDNHVWNLEWATVLEQNSDPMRMKNMSKSMRLIDADALIEFIDMGHLRNQLESCFSERDVVDMLESRPTIDAVPVVRCRECKHRSTEDCPMYFHSSYWHEGYEEYVDDDTDHTEDDYFCQEGERKEGADNG